MASNEDVVLISEDNNKTASSPVQSPPAKARCISLPFKPPKDKKSSKKYYNVFNIQWEVEFKEDCIKASDKGGSRPRNTNSTES